MDEDLDSVGSTSNEDDQPKDLDCLHVRLLFACVDPSQQAIHHSWPRLLQRSASSSAAQTQESDEVIPEEKATFKPERM
ncbi:hypothetical protein SUGI_1170870 [Cryptomeria japonica]|nr:hypothetical protein SUGI_1170870 [Cryptomeria japonica]